MKKINLIKTLKFSLKGADKSTMKRLNHIYFLSIVMLGFLSVIPLVHAEDESAQVNHDLLSGIKEVEAVNSEVKKAGVLPPKCPGCADKEPDLKATLDKKEVDIGNPYYRRDNEPYVVYLKRTSETPAKVDLKFKNGYRYCERMFVGANPLSGALMMDCMLYLHRYEDEEISLNLKNLPKLKPGEEELIEIKFTKKDINTSKYTIEVKHFGENSQTEEIDKKFFGAGYNVNFKAKKDAK